MEEAAPETEAQPETEAAASEQIPETQPATEGEPVVTDTPAAEGGSRDEILPLLQSASALVTADVAANKAAAATLLTQAKEKADSDYPAAGSIIGAAITLLDTDSPDGSSVATLIQSAIDAIG